jgi:hypothetical protein
MKYLFTALTMFLTVTSTQAFFDDASWNNDEYGNGFIAYNKYDYMDPRWMSTEFTNIITEIDNEFEFSDHSTVSTYDFPIVVE